MAFSKNFTLVWKIAVVILVLSQQYGTPTADPTSVPPKGCLDDTQCLNYGKCKPSGGNSSYCSCVSGFKGDHCQNKITRDKVVCGNFQTRTFIAGNIITHEHDALKFKICDSAAQKCHNLSYAYRTVRDKTSIDMKGILFGCLLSDYKTCPDYEEFFKNYAVKMNYTNGALKMSCCHGDFCNIGSDFLKGCLKGKPCLNYGKCKSVGNSPYCLCASDFYGDRCQYSKYCSSNPCKNGGKCVENPSDPNSYLCNCSKEYTGARCENVNIEHSKTSVSVKEGHDITINCDASSDSTARWERVGDEMSGRMTIKGLQLILRNASTNDVGTYMCTKGESTLTVYLSVNITVKVKISLRILNWDYTEEMNNTSSDDYKTFEKNFTAQMNEVYKDLEGYAGVEILEVRSGSLKVRFRITVVVPIKKKGQRTVKTKVEVTQRVIVRAETGWIENLMVDSEDVETDSPPPAPQNVTLEESFEDGAEISWVTPMNHKYFSINGYFIQYWEFGSTTKKTTDTSKGVSSEIKGLSYETAYVAEVLAVNSNGDGEESDSIEFKTYKRSLRDWEIALIIVGGFLFVVVIVAIIIVCCRKRKRKQKEERERRMFPMENIEHKFPSDPDKNDPRLKSFTNERYSFFSTGKWKTFSKDELVFLNKLGSGEFGDVYKGQLIEGPSVRECAIKTLKGDGNAEGYRDLFKELEIMANVGYHPNLINLIGAVCEDDDLYVIVEFAVHGSLVDYLKKTKLYPDDGFTYERRLSISLDVAKGMFYLAEKRCVHRDLAARNILLTENFVAKVADFGMSRDIYESGVYEKTTSGKLPTRWMAIESLDQRRFTIETDVWSFGVLLWEIETQGLLPYGAIQFNELMKKLNEGYRLEQPIGTPDELYRLMQICWSADPKKRPTFEQISDTLEYMISDYQGIQGKPFDVVHLDDDSHAYTQSVQT